MKRTLAPVARIVGTLCLGTSLAACTSGAESTDQSTTDLVVTDTTDTATTDDTTTEPDVFTDVTFTLSGNGSIEGTALALHRLADRLGNFEVFASAAVSSPTPTIALPTPTDDELTAGTGGVETAVLLAAVHDDLDGDTEPEAGEPFVGVQADLAFVYQTAEANGFPKGWSVVDVRTGGLVPIDAVPMFLVGELQQVTLTGAFDGDVAPPVVALPEAWVEDGTFGELLVDEVLPIDTDAGTYTLTVEGAPPASHPATDDPSMAPGTVLESIFTYVDVDESGTFTEGDTSADGFLLCQPDGTSFEVGIGWFAPTDDIRVALDTRAITGWSVFVTVVTQSGPQVLPLGNTPPDLSLGACPEAG